MLQQSKTPRDIAIKFLMQNSDKRMDILKQLGIGRYVFLTKMHLNEANIVCVMRFLGNSYQVKFPKLMGADLSALVLDNANFIRGDLTDANLRGASLIDADLIFANLTNADLREANLTGATLNETIWNGALVEGCLLDKSIGLTQKQRKDLQIRGARFESLEDDK